MFYPEDEEKLDNAFVLYNVMHQEKFYNIWTNDLLRHIMQYKRRK